MKKKYIIGIAIAIVFIVFALLSFNDNRIEYTDILSAKQSGKIVQIVAQRVESKKYKFDPANNLLTFVMKDEKGKTAEVQYKGAPPNNFDIAPSLVLKGKFQNDVFIATQILTKCPSKYEGKDPSLHIKNN